MRLSENTNFQTVSFFEVVVKVNKVKIINK